MKEIFLGIYLSIGTLQTDHFINKYNKMVDPNGQLSTICFYKETINTQISSEMFNAQINNVSDCYHTSKGRSICFRNSGQVVPMGIFDLNGIGYKKNLIRVLLHQFVESSDEKFKIIYQDDSITHLYQQLKNNAYHVYTINSQNFQLIEMKSVSERNGNDFVRFTYFFEYKEIEGINIPTRIEYSSEIAKATLVYEDISFEPFDESVFEY